MFKVSKMPLVYAGSVKNLRSRKRPTVHKPGVFVFEFTDDYSIFDYGKMPDTIPGKGAAMAMGTAFFFEQIESPKAWKLLAQSKVWSKIKNRKLRDSLQNCDLFKRLQKEGMPTHYRGLVHPETGNTVRLSRLKKPSNLLEVDSVRILEPEAMTFAGKRIWNYNRFCLNTSNYLVPLECVFRFGLPKGSSLFERIKMPGYLESLGLTNKPKPNDWLERPVVEYFSKLEPADRHLDYELALNVSGLSNEDYENLYLMTILTAVFLLDFFSKARITLWDGKFEYLMGQKGLMLGDAITPDELRLTYKGVQISKEPLRQYYRKYAPEFVTAMNQAKGLAKKQDKSLRDIVCEDLKCPPPTLDPRFIKAMSDMYTGLVSLISGGNLFGDAPPMSGVLRVFRKFKIV